MAGRLGNWFLNAARAAKLTLFSPTLTQSVHRCFTCLSFLSLSQVDGQGAAVVVAATAGGAVLGGYNPDGWIGLGEDRASNGAFLFTWPSGDTRKPAFKLAKVRCGSRPVSVCNVA